MSWYFRKSASKPVESVGNAERGILCTSIFDVYLKSSEKIKEPSKYITINDITRFKKFKV